MPSTRLWLWLALSIPAAVGLFVVSRVLVYSRAPMQEGDKEFALRIMAFNRIPCSHITRLVRGFGDESFGGYGEGTITVQCEDGTRYVVFSQPLCSETLGCRWLDLLCWNVERE